MNIKHTIQRVDLHKLFVLSFWLCAAVLLVLVVIPDDPENGGLLTMKFTETGFIVHAAAYFVLFGLGVAAYPSALMRLIAGVVLYGVVCEVIQLYIPYRSFNPVDIAANVLGMVLFYVLYIFCKRINHGGPRGGTELTEEELNTG